MADFIELKTPDRYAAKGFRFGDYTLDVQSIHDNCKRIADDIARDGSPETRRRMQGEVLKNTGSIIIELGKVVVGHREYIKGLSGTKP